MVVPARNSEATIDKCLESIKNQTYPNIEIIVVDNYSTDRTCEIARRFGARVYLMGPERSSQRNLGVKMARGKYVYDVGSDFVVEANVIEECVRKCERDGFDAIAVHNTSDPTISFWSKVRKLERDCYRNDELNVAARFLRKEIFEKVGGFDESLIAGEDYDLHNRLLKTGFAVGTIRPQEVHIGEPKSISEIARKHYYYGKTIRRYLNANPDKGLRQISPFRPALIRNWRIFLRFPVLTSGFIIYQIVRYSAASLGFVSSLHGKQ